MPLHDFRSDTVTLPTPEMMRAIAEAPLGDSARGDDPTVNELERVAAELLGKEAALFVPSGAMANLSAVIAHGCQGGEVIVEESAHLYNAEGGGLSVVAGAIPRPVPGRRGMMDLRAAEAVIRGDHDLALAPTRLICVENTHNASGGAVLPVTYLQDVQALAARHGLPLHMDGARLFNAATALDVPVRALCEPVDSVWFAACKGLGGPVGAVLAGSACFMRRARRAARMLGGGMRQAGLIAAPALVALRDPYAAHRRDHALARRLARGLADIDASLVDAAGVQTNIVNCFVDAFADEAKPVAQALRERGVLANAKRTKIRFVTHSQVGDDDVDAAIEAMAEVLKLFPRRSV